LKAQSAVSKGPCGCCEKNLRFNVQIVVFSEPGAFSRWLRPCSVTLPAPLPRTALPSRKITPACVSSILLLGITAIGGIGQMGCIKGVVLLRALPEVEDLTSFILISREKSACGNFLLG
jgi:hypothetical protein